MKGERGGKNKSLWSDEALQEAIEALDAGNTYVKVPKYHNIPKSSLRDHYVGKRRNRKMEGEWVLSKEEDEAVCKYILDMIEIGLPLIPIQMHDKIAKIIQRSQLLSNKTY